MQTEEDDVKKFVGRIFYDQYVAFKEHKKERLEQLKRDQDNAHLDPVWSKLPRRCQLMISPRLPVEPKVPIPDRIAEATECFQTCPRIISREEWQARPPKVPATQMLYRVRPAIHLETDTYNCNNKEDCLKVIQFLQAFQMEDLNFSDIALSFLIGEDGIIYEGRGWACENENSTGFTAIGYFGFFSNEPLEGPTDIMLQATYDLIMCGIKKGFLTNPFHNGKFTGRTPIELMKELILIKEEVDFRATPEEFGLDEDDFELQF